MQLKLKKKDLLGTWTLVSWTRKCVEDETISYPFGKNPQGQLELTEEKIFVTAYKDNQSFSTVPTIEDFLAKPDVIEFSYSGKYTLQGDEIDTSYEACTDKTKVGQRRIMRLWFDGHNTLIFTAKEPIKINDKHYVPSGTWIKNIS